MGAQASNRTGRPVRWTPAAYFRLWSYVDYYRTDLRQSVRNACRYISVREPWSATGLSAETLRRRFAEAEKLHKRGAFGTHLRPDATLEDFRNASLEFIFDLDDIKHMMGTFRFRIAEQEYEQQWMAAQDELHASYKRPAGWYANPPA